MRTAIAVRPDNGLMGSTLRSWIGVATAAVFLVFSCAQTTDTNDKSSELLVDRQVVVDGEDRIFDLYIPATVDHGSVPAVVILLHGQRSSRADLEGESRRTSPFAEWRSVADANGLLLVVPQGLD